MKVKRNREERRLYQGDVIILNIIKGIKRTEG